MSSSSFIAAVILCGSHPAAADRTIAVDVTSPVPFDARELASAIRVRLPAEGAPVELHVSAIAEGVRVEARAGTRDIALDGMTGAPAARLVALAAADLLVDDLGVSAASPPPSTRTVEVGLAGAVARWDGMLGGVALDVAVRRGRALVAAELGGGAVTSHGLHLYSGVLRLGGGIRTGALELRGGLTVAPVIATDGAGDRALLLGAGASARLHLPLGAGISAVIIAGLDAFATRTHYAVAGMPVTATPWFSPWAGLGVEVLP